MCNRSILRRIGLAPTRADNARAAAAAAADQQALAQANAALASTGAALRDAQTAAAQGGADPSRSSETSRQAMERRTRRLMSMRGFGAAVAGGGSAATRTAPVAVRRLMGE